MNIKTKEFLEELRDLLDRDYASINWEKDGSVYIFVNGEYINFPRGIMAGYVEQVLNEKN